MSDVWNSIQMVSEKMADRVSRGFSQSLFFFFDVLIQNGGQYDKRS